MALLPYCVVVLCDEFPSTDVDDVDKMKPLRTTMALSSVPARTTGSVPAVNVLANMPSPCESVGVRPVVPNTEP